MQFIVGRTYSTRSICDHNCIISVTIASRTAKMITTTDGKRFRVALYEGVEQIKPWGSYSMCPIIGADDKDLSAVIHPAYQEAAERDNAAYDATLRDVEQAMIETIRPADIRHLLKIVG